MAKTNKYLERLTKLANHPTVKSKRMFLFDAHKVATGNQAKVITHKGGWTMIKPKLLEDEVLITQKWISEDEANEMLGEYF
jgi:hypothetical protein